MIAPNLTLGIGFDRVNFLTYPSYNSVIKFLILILGSDPQIWEIKFYEWIT